MRLKACLLLCLVISSSVSAEVVSDAMRAKAGLNLRAIQEEGPDRARSGRLAWSAYWTHPIRDRLRWESGLYLAPDKKVLPQTLKVTEDWYGAFSGLEISYPFYFRWFTSAGLQAQYERMNILFKSDSGRQENSSTFFQWVPYLCAGAEYAINDSYEVSLELGLQRRSLNERIDWFWGIGLGYNVF